MPRHVPSSSFSPPSSSCKGCRLSNIGMSLPPLKSHTEPPSLRDAVCCDARNPMARSCECTSLCCPTHLATRPWRTVCSRTDFRLNSSIGVQYSTQLSITLTEESSGMTTRWQHLFSFLEQACIIFFQFEVKWTGLVRLQPTAVLQVFFFVPNQE